MGCDRERKVYELTSLGKTAVRNAHVEISQIAADTILFFFICRECLDVFSETK